MDSIFTNASASKVAACSFIFGALCAMTVYTKSDSDKHRGKIAEEVKSVASDRLTSTFSKIGIQHKAEGNQAHDESTTEEGNQDLPKQLKPLSYEEKKKKIKERISEKFVGEIPMAMQLIINYLEHLNENKHFPVSNRILLHGAPGLGKSYLVKTVSQESEVALFSIPAYSLVSKYRGETQRNITKAFDSAREYVEKHNRPVIIFIDEIDAITTARNSNPDYKGALVALAHEMDNVQDNKNIIVVATTDNISSIDPLIKDRFIQEEIKELSIQQKAQLVQKIFAASGIKIEPKLAQQIAKDAHASGASNRAIRDRVAGIILDQAIKNKSKN